jgi:hypothetical protein
MIEMDLKVRLTESQYEVLKTVADAAGDSLEKWLHSAVIGEIEADIDVYFRSKSIKEKLYKMIKEVS